MRNAGWMARFVVTATVLQASAVVLAQVELKNDNYLFGGVDDPGTPYPAVADGEITAARFVPAGPCTITKVMAVTAAMVPIGTTAKLRIYDDSALTDNPGAELMTAQSIAIGMNMSPELAEFDLTTSGPVTANGPFRVGFDWISHPAIIIGQDTDGITYADRNFLYQLPGNWVRTSSFSLPPHPGDWIIRVEVVYHQDAGVQQDAAVPLDAAGLEDGAAQGDAAGLVDAAVQPDGGGGQGDAAVQPDGGGDQACQENSSCPAGQYCGTTKVCTYDCLRETDCGSGSTCSSLGQCVKKGGGCTAAAPRAGTATLVLAALAGVAGLRGLRRRRR